MAKRDYFLLVDTETSQSGKVADIACLIIDKQGREYARLACLVAGVFEDEPLFYTSGDPSNHFDKSSLEKRTQAYRDMLTNGERMLASVQAINSWLVKALIKYKPILTAYNLNFDSEKCRNTGIDLTIFSTKFCLWYASVHKWASTKAYKNFVLENHYFNAPTALNNMSFKTNAEVMARFVLGDPALPDEPHTALEDIQFYELPILLKLVQTTKKVVYLNPPVFNWRDVQVKNHFTSK